ncbi:MAG: ABC transporter ATP-binding protein [Candidatus Tectomicrobia bacterium]|nr:ABC transporter ATP-binding protein [Candidatus Tectomicrobia bacterium]
MKPLLVESVTKNFGGFNALNGVTLDFEPGERRAIIGPNGAGKTTLFNVITGVLPPSAGRVVLFGRDVTRLPMHRRSALGLARTFQINTLFPKLTITENVALAVQAQTRLRYVCYRPWRAYRALTERCDALLTAWGLWDLRDARVSELSYGDQRQVEIVLAMATQPKVLLLDEPTAGLSTAETAVVTALIKQLDPSITIVLIEHDMDVALHLAERITVLHYGEKVAEGSPEEIKTNPLVAEIYLGAGLT